MELSDKNFDLQVSRYNDLTGYLIVRENQYQYQFECYNLFKLDGKSDNSDNSDDSDDSDDENNTAKHIKRLDNISTLIYCKKVKPVYILNEAHELLVKIGKYKFIFKSDMWYSGVSLGQIYDAMKLTDLKELKSAYANLAAEYNNLKSDYIERLKA